MTIWSFLLILLLSADEVTVGERPLPPSGGLPETFTYPIPQNEDCRTLQPNESRIVNIPTSESHTGLSSRYEISRINDSQVYRIDLNINFIVHDDYWADQPFLTRRRPRLIEQFTQRAQACLDQAQTILNVPGGPSFRIFINQNRGGEIPPAIDVNIRATGFQSNSTNWDNSDDCSIITHETMHLLGLIDGYPKRDDRNLLSDNRYNHICSNHQRSNASGAGCLHSEPPNIMSDYYPLMNDDGFMAIVCQPLTSLTSTPRSTQTVPTLSCPSGYRADYMNPMAMPMSAIQERLVSAQNDGALVLVSRVPRRTSGALAPAHARHILKPRCVSENQRYLTCLRTALVGQGNSCLNTPASCQGDFTQ